MFCKLILTHTSLLLFLSIAPLSSARLNPVEIQKSSLQGLEHSFFFLTPCFWKQSRMHLSHRPDEQQFVCHLQIPTPYKEYSRPGDQKAADISMDHGGFC